MQERKLSAALLGGAFFVMIAAPEVIALIPHISIFPTFLGIQCPGCGVVSGIVAVLHGSWAEAWEHNPASFLVLPYLILVGIRISTCNTVLEHSTKWLGRLTLTGLITIFCLRLMSGLSPYV